MRACVPVCVCVCVCLCALVLLWPLPVVDSAVLLLCSLLTAELTYIGSELFLSWSSWRQRAAQSVILKCVLMYCKHTDTNNHTIQAQIWTPAGESNLNIWIFCPRFFCPSSRHNTDCIPLLFIFCFSKEVDAHAHTHTHTHTHDYLLDSDLLQRVFFIDLLFLFGHRDPAGRVRSSRNTTSCSRLWINNTAGIRSYLPLSCKPCALREIRLWGNAVCLCVYTHLRCVCFSLRRPHAHLVSWGGLAWCWLVDLWRALRWPAAVAPLYSCFVEQVTQREAETSGN